MKKAIFLKLTVVMAMSVLVLTACSNPSNGVAKPEKQTTEPIESEETAEPEEALTVEITDAHGTVTVPVNPKNVISLDSRSYETLADWGIVLAVAPKGVMPADSPYVSDDLVLDIGNHREPNLEIVAAADPELAL